MSAIATTAAFPGHERLAKPPQPREVEADLIRAAQQGNLAAFEELICRYDRAVLGLAMRLTGSQEEAQDVYQEAFLKAYKNIGRFRRESSFYSWVYRIVTNVGMDRLRTQRSRREQSPIVTDRQGRNYDLTEQLVESRPHANPERVALQQELRREIDFALQKLTPRERIVFELKNYEGLGLRAVGEILNTSEETAKNTLFRGIRKLRIHLAHLRIG